LGREYAACREPGSTKLSDGSFRLEAEKITLTLIDALLEKSDLKDALLILLFTLFINEFLT